MDNNEIKDPRIKLLKSAEELASAIEKSDKYLRSRKIIESTNNWMIAVCAGTLLWMFTNLDNIYCQTSEDRIIFRTEVFVFIPLIFLFSLIFLCINKYILVSRELIMCSAVDSLNSLVEHILKSADDDADEDELAEICQYGTQAIIDEWIRGHNLIEVSPELLKIGIVLYLLGFVSLALYLIKFLINVY